MGNHPAPQPLRLVIRGPLVSRLAIGARDFDRSSFANRALRAQAFRVAEVQQRGDVPHFVLEPFSLTEVRAWQRAETQRLKAAANDALQVGSIWSGTRTYRKGFWAGTTVTYELHVETRRGPNFTGHVFDKGPGRNRAEVTGQVDGESITWREQTANPNNHVNITGQLSGNAIRLTLQGERTDATIYTEGDGELQRLPGEE